MKFLSDKMIPEFDNIETVSFDSAAPTGNIDWSSKGISRVKNQGQCGSCWAFSATGVMESWRIIVKKEAKASVELSEQQLVDCSKPENHGCNGGWPSRAIDYVIKHGIKSEAEYPYVGRDQACKVQGGSFKVSRQFSTNQASCSGLINGLTSRPLSVTVDASNWSSYHSGILANCGTSINHAVLLVGSVDGAYKIKNSWATSWGEGGFIRLAGAGSHNTCGVCTYGGVYVG